MTNMRKNQQLGWLWVVPFLLLATALAARSLNVDTIWIDEFYMISDSRASLSLPFIALNLAETNPWHVPGYFYLLNFWGRILGWEWQPYIMRVPALLIGLLSIAMTYRFGRDYFSQRVGMFAAIIMSVSAILAYFMHEIRMYSTNIFLAVFVLWLYWRIVDPTRKKIAGWEYPALFITFVICLYTHYFLAVLLGAIGLYHLLFVAKTRRWLIVSGVGIGAVVTFLPWLNTLLNVADRMSSGESLADLTTPELALLIGNIFSHQQLWLWLILMALALLPLIMRQDKNRYVRGLWFITIVAVGALLLVNAVLGVIPERRARYVILIWPLLATLTAVGITQLETIKQIPAQIRPMLAVGVMSVWGIIGVYSTLTPQFTSFLPSTEMAYPLNNVMHDLEPVHRPGDFVLHIIPDDLRYYWYRRVLPLYLEHGLAADTALLSPYAENRPDETDVINAIGREYGREYIWLSSADERSEITEQYRQEIQTQIETETPYQYCGAIQSPDGTQIDQFAPADVCCYPQTRSENNPIVIYDAMSMAGIEVDLDTESDQLSVWVAWDGSDQLPEDAYSYGLPILDSNGELVTNVDSPMPSAPYICQNRQLDLSGLAAGTYHLHTVVYEWNGGARLAGTPATASQPTDLPEILTFSVEDDGTINLE